MSLALKLTKIALELIPGGLAEGKSPLEFDSEQLAAGMLVELEHTDNIFMAREIAMDHLMEDKNYYIKLRKMENEEPRAYNQQEIKALFVNKLDLLAKQVSKEAETDQMSYEDTLQRYMHSILALREQTEEYFGKLAGWTEEGYIEPSLEELSQMIINKDFGAIQEEGGIKAVLKLIEKYPGEGKKLEYFIKELSREEFQNKMLDVQNAFAGFYKYEKKVKELYSKMRDGYKKKIKEYDLDLPSEIYQEDEYELYVSDIERLMYAFVLDYNEHEELIKKTILKNASKLKELAQLYRSFRDKLRVWKASQFKHPMYGITLQNTWAEPSYDSTTYERNVESIEKMLEEI